MINPNARKQWLGWLGAGAVLLAGSGAVAQHSHKPNRDAKDTYVVKQQFGVIPVPMSARELADKAEKIVNQATKHYAESTKREVRQIKSDNDKKSEKLKNLLLQDQRTDIKINRKQERNSRLDSLHRRQVEILDRTREENSARSDKGYLLELRKIDGHYESEVYKLLTQKDKDFVQCQRNWTKNLRSGDNMPLMPWSKRLKSLQTPDAKLLAQRNEQLERLGCASHHKGLPTQEDKLEQGKIQAANQTYEIEVDRAIADYVAKRDRVNHEYKQQLDVAAKRHDRAGYISIVREAVSVYPNLPDDSKFKQEARPRNKHS